MRKLTVESLFEVSPFHTTILLCEKSPSELDKSPCEIQNDKTLEVSQLQQYTEESDTS